VPLELLHSFKRMRRFQPFSAIVEALKTSEMERRNLSIGRLESEK
jgi:vacuolar-type H+-ATPase subunit C/Vma6